MNEAAKQGALSAVRALLVAAGGAFTAKGIVDEQTAQTVIAALMTLIPIVWGIVDKYQSERKTRERVEDAYNAGATNMPPPTPPGDKP